MKACKFHSLIPNACMEAGNRQRPVGGHRRREGDPPQTVRHGPRLDARGPGEVDFRRQRSRPQGQGDGEGGVWVRGIRRRPIAHAVSACQARAATGSGAPGFPARVPRPRPHGATGRDPTPSPHAATSRHPAVGEEATSHPQSVGNPHHPAADPLVQGWHCRSPGGTARSLRSIGMTAGSAAPPPAATVRSIACPASLSTSQPRSVRSAEQSIGVRAFGSSAVDEVWLHVSTTQAS